MCDITYCYAFYGMQSTLTNPLLTVYRLQQVQWPIDIRYYHHLRRQVYHLHHHQLKKSDIVYSIIIIMTN